jgi:hypothetical protein
LEFGDLRTIYNREKFPEDAGVKRYSQLVPPREFSLSRLVICDCEFVGMLDGIQDVRMEAVN